MLFKKKVKGGIMLYALLMVSIFSLLLTYYLHRQSMAHNLYQASQRSHQAAAIALVSEQELLKSYQKDPKLQPGVLYYQEGDCRYKLEEKNLTLTVQLETGKSYEYHVALPSKSD